MATEDDAQGRGKRDSPRTPAKDADGKLQKLREISMKLSPSASDVPPMPKDVDQTSASSGTEGAHLPPVAPKASVGVGSASSEGPFTLSAIRNLLKEELEPVTASVEKLSADLAGLKKKMQEELGAMGLRLTKVESGNASLDKDVKKLQEDLKRVEAATTARMQEQMQQLTVNASTENLTVIIGAIPNAKNVEEALAWITKMCSGTGIPRPVDVYCKSTDYNGIMFAKCLSASHRDQLIASIRQGPRGSSVKPWAQIDLPIDRRTAESALFCVQTHAG